MTICWYTKLDCQYMYWHVLSETSNKAYFHLCLLLVQSCLTGKQVVDGLIKAHIVVLCAHV